MHARPIPPLGRVLLRRAHLRTGQRLHLADNSVIRMLIFHAPPLLLTSEAKALARKVGQLLMVVRDGVTRIEDLTSAYACVESVPHVLSLLNGSPLEDAKPGYASGYGYAA